MLVNLDNVHTDRVPVCDGLCCNLYIGNQQRQKQATSDAFNVLQEQVFDKLNPYTLDSRKRDEDTTSRIAANP